MNQNDKNKLEKFGMTHNQIRELKSFYVERYVDNIFEVLEGAVDKYYNKLEAAKKKQPKAEW